MVAPSMSDIAPQEGRHRERRMPATSAVLVMHLAAGMARVAGAQAERVMAGLGDAVADLLAAGRAFGSLVAGGFLGE